MIKVVDIFAGPGGLSEGFAAIRDRAREQAFEIVLSIEKDAHAYETLRLRTFYRQFPSKAPSAYYQCLRGEISVKELHEMHPAEAKAASDQCWHATLGAGGGAC